MTRPEKPCRYCRSIAEARARGEIHSGMVSHICEVDPPLELPTLVRGPEGQSTIIDGRIHLPNVLTGQDLADYMDDAETGRVLSRAELDEHGLRGAWRWLAPGERLQTDDLHVQTRQRGESVDSSPLQKDEAGWVRELDSTPVEIQMLSPEEAQERMLELAEHEVEQAETRRDLAELELELATRDRDRIEYTLIGLRRLGSEIAWAWFAVFLALVAWWCST